MQITDKKDIPNTATVSIEKLSNLGYGVAHIDGYVVFVPNACPGDFVNIRLTKKNKTYGFADIIEIIEPSKNRVEPFCKMQKICGACQIQYIEYSAQLKYKKEIVADTMRSILGSDLVINDVIPSPEIQHYRHKIQYPISETRDSKRIIAGYYKLGSHELINIKHCPIQPESADLIIDYIREVAKKCSVSGYLENTHKGLLRHVVIRSSAYNDKNIVVLVINESKCPDSIKQLANMIYSELDNIKGVCVNYNDKKTNLILGERTECLEGDDYIEETLCDKIFKIGAKTFFQVNPKSADNIFRYIKNFINNNYSNPTVLDAYAGIAAFGICVSDISKRVTSIEESIDSIELAKKITRENNINNVELLCGDAAKHFEKLIKENFLFDITIVDPPRKGCTEESLKYALKLTKGRIIYVSCNPATLARDLKFLYNNGAKIESIQPFDMFPHTFHIENVAIINVENC